MISGHSHRLPSRKHPRFKFPATLIIYAIKVAFSVDNVQAQLKQSSDYQLLGLSNHEGHLLKRHVRNAYRRQSRKLHPDAGGNDEAFKELHAAYRRVLASVPKE
jgi:DnaJ-class molecular chaperone